MTSENYPGELEMFRGLVRVLRIAARNEDMPEVQRLLWDHARDEADAYAQAQVAPDPTAADLERQTALMAGIRQEPARRWKSGRAVGLLRRLGYHPISPRTASRDLAALAGAGLLVMHEEKGVRWYEVAARRPHPTTKHTGNS
ncbi:hypothetical protein [Streptomyces luteogriseus]|uniref:hypothetical protein n=1 Tax=Streptomyces luteogriseus TaxID=68233 RepID=UPI0037BCCC45